MLRLLHLLLAALRLPRRLLPSPSPAPTPQPHTAPPPQLQPEPSTGTDQAHRPRPYLPPPVRAQPIPCPSKAGPELVEQPALSVSKEPALSLSKGDPAKPHPPASTPPQPQPKTAPPPHPPYPRKPDSTPAPDACQTPPKRIPRRLKSFLEKTLIAREAPNFACLGRRQQLPVFGPRRRPAPPLVRRAGKPGSRQAVSDHAARPPSTCMSTQPGRVASPAPKIRQKLAPRGRQPP